MSSRMELKYIYYSFAYMYAIVLTFMVVFRVFSLYNDKSTQNPTSSLCVPSSPPLYFLYLFHHSQSFVLSSVLQYLGFIYKYIFYILFQFTYIPSTCELITHLSTASAYFSQHDMLQLYSGCSESYYFIYFIDMISNIHIFSCLYLPHYLLILLDLCFFTYPNIIFQ